MAKFMTKLNPSLKTLALMVSLIVSAGCGDPSSLTGKVTLDGQPLTGATVVFYPQQSDTTIVVGVTDDAGHFEVTPAVGSGIRPGEYRVTVSKRQAKASKAKPKKAVPPPPDENFPGAAATGDLLVLPEDTIPPRYSDAGLTELKITSPPAGEILLELTSK
ncbi:MAG: carboxypeptidase-like regulatory domain-containing protein [Bacteroidales bacterium]|nr:carboxypeptidase-like regulatory domain-containing protein [Bacteroidales bacterium]